MGHIQWLAAYDPSYLCDALLITAVLDSPDSPMPLDLANEEFKSWKARVLVLRSPETATACGGLKEALIVDKPAI